MTKQLTKWEKLKANKFAIDFSDAPSETKQADLAATDINLIMARYMKTGVLPEGVSASELYGDFSTVPDFLEAQNIVARANEQFDALPAALRKEFDNDAARFLEFASNPDNTQALGDMLAESVGLERVDPTPLDAVPGPATRLPEASGKGKKAAKDAANVRDDDFDGGV